jgi:hypothetical protein
MGDDDVIYLDDDARIVIKKFVIIFEVSYNFNYLLF